VIFLDTNVISETMRSRPSGNVEEWIVSARTGLHVSTVVLAELRFGIAKCPPAQRSPGWEPALESWRAYFGDRIHAFDEASAEVYGEIMGNAALAGRIVDAVDGMIAAVAIRHDAALATRNIRHFAGLPLKLIDPWAFRP
jgi:predicted nucleic acid-binding protein